jgi:hypothetical protein
MWPFKRKTRGTGYIDIARNFTGNCMVWQHTGDGHYVGPCWHSTYNGVCHVHGNVAIYLDDVAEWPKDYDLEPKSMGA